MPEGMSEHSAESRPRLRLITNPSQSAYDATADDMRVDERPDDEITQVIKADPDDTIVQERDRFSATLRNPSPDRLRAAFEGFESGADKLTSSYNVTGFAMPEGGEKAYELSIEGQGEYRNDAPTTIAIGVASEDGRPDWKIDGPEIDTGYELALVKLIEITIAKLRRT